MSTLDMKNLANNIINYYSFERDKKYLCSILKIVKMKYKGVDAVRMKEVILTALQEKKGV